MESIHRFARERIDLASDKMKTRYDARAKEPHFKEGDRVWFYNPTRRKGLCPKLQHNWEGPYIVIKKLNDVVVRIRKSPTAKPRVVHIDRLTPFYEDTARDEQSSRRGAV